jgi:ABC-type sugar transport system ATPase subunit
MPQSIAVQFESITKRFPGVTALDAVDVSIAAGSCHALCGENGAGKSTLGKILAGIYAPEAGRLIVHGAPVTFATPMQALAAGVAMVHQEIAFCENLSVAENLSLGALPTRGGFLARPAMRRRAEEMLATIGADIDVRTTLGDLTIAQQQLVQIAGAVSGGARIVVFDEPTSSISQHEAERLYGLIDALKQRGVTCIYVSHRLEEIFRLADTVTVLRDGRHVITTTASGLTRNTLIRHMVGRDVSEEFPARTSVIGGTVLEVEHLASPPRFTDLSFSVHRGEILGIAGLVGAGRTSAALAAIGAIAHTGEVRLNGAPVRFGTPADAIAGGLAYVTEDRKAHGLFPLLGLDENIAVTHLSRFARAGVLSIARRSRHVREAVRDLDIRASGIGQPAGTLSGGNQQKALVARYLVRPPKVLIVDEPTRGVDVGARAEIYRVLNALTAEGMAVVMISSDLPEVLGMSDRIVVMREGRITGQLTRADATADRVMALAAAS